MRYTKQGPKKRKTLFSLINIYKEDHPKIKALAETEGIGIAEYIHRVAIKGMPKKEPKAKGKK